MISDCVQELFMLVIALCTACFSMAKINKKKLGAPYFKIWPLYFECSGAGTLFTSHIKIHLQTVCGYAYSILCRCKLQEFKKLCFVAIP